MNPPAINPLTEEHCACFDAILKAEADIRDLIERCKTCKIDLGQREQMYNDAVETARLLKQQFFPDRS